MSRAESAATTATSPVRGAPSGREVELSRLEAEFHEAKASRSFRIAFLRGPAGVGRTAVLEELARRLAARTAPILAGAAPRARQVPFALWRTVVAAALERLRPTLPSATLRGFDERLAPLDGRAAPAGAGPLDVCTAVTEVVLRAARDEAVVLLLDDVDAADPASLAVLASLIGTLSAPGALRAPDEPAAGGLVVLSLRDDAPPKALEELTARTAALSIPLGALDLEGVRGYLSRTRAAERLLEATGGVPARLEELLAPGGAIDFAARRLERLAAPDRELLQALAVLGQPAEAELVAVVSGRNDAAQRLSRLAQSGLAHASPAAGRTLFHVGRDADRRALLATLGVQDRHSLHLAAGEAFAARVDVESAFDHFAQAGDGARAAPAGLAAAELLVQRLAFEAAESVLARLAGLALGAPERARVLLALAAVLERKGDARGALAALGRARPLLPVAEHRGLRARSARLCLALGAPRPAERLARAVLGISALEDSVLDAAALDATVALADARFLRGAYDEALATVLAAGDLPAPHRLLLANVRGKALLTLGRLDEAKVVFRANAEDADRCSEPSERARALLNVGVVAHRQGDRREARDVYREALARGDGPFAAIVHANLASLLLEEGEAEEALAQSHRALAAFSRQGRAKEQAHAAQNLARAYLHIGDLARSEEVAVHAAQLANRVGDPYVAAGACLVTAEVLLARGDAKAADALCAAADSFEKLKNPRYLRESLLLLADALLARREAAAAAAALDRARAAGALGEPALAAELHLLDAELQLTLSSDDAAAAALGKAREALLCAPQLELPARLYFLQGALAERREEHAQAQADRLKAVRILDELAARVPPDRRPLFFSRPRRRAILDAAGRALVDVPRAPATLVARSAEGAPRPLIGRSPQLARVNALIDRIGPSTATVLVRGESGTGKELVARALHERSDRRHLPIVAVNCGALSEELLFSELFGHEKGAFTGAIKDRKGRFELADGSTIFLDEIGDISPRAQVALLRVLQERTFERVGGSRTLKVDVRIVCATNRNLEEQMANGEFREDLYYRLRGASLLLPPLRDRLEDLPELATHILDGQARERGEAPRVLSSEALRVLRRYRWPGNVRELQNVLESASLLTSGATLGPEAFELFPELFEPEALRVPTAPAAVASARPPVVDAPLATAAPLPVAAEPAVLAAVPAPAEGALDFYALLKHRDLSLKDLRRELDIACIASALTEGGGIISEAGRLLKMKRSRLSQIVKSEPQLRALCRGGAEATGAGDDEEDDEGGPVLAPLRSL